MRRTVHWPDNKKICATFTVAFEAYTRAGHFKTLDLPGVNLFSISHADYGGNAGIWRIMDVLERANAHATIDVNGLAVEKWPDAVKALHRAGHELAGHAYTNEVKMTSLSPDEQRADIRKVTELIAQATGERSVGWVSPGGNHTEETLGILAEEGYTWCGDRCDDDPPYVVEINGRRIVIIPKHGSSTICAAGTAAGSAAPRRSRRSSTASISSIRRRCAAVPAASTRSSMPSSAAAPIWRMPSRRWCNIASSSRTISGSRAGKRSRNTC